MKQKILPSLLVLLGLALCSSPVTAAGLQKKGAPPSLQFVEEAGTTRVLWDQQIIVEFEKNRFVRFRATPENELWIGSEKSGADLGWVYRDDGAKGMDVKDLKHEYSPATGDFVVRIAGKKPQFDGQIDVVFTGKWLPETRQYKYILSTRLRSPLESWYENSKFRQRGLPSTGSKMWTEVLDYCIEGVTITERMLSPDTKRRNTPQLYEWFVRSSDGEEWEKWPKIHIPFPVRPGDYLTIRDRENPTQQGGLYGFLDKKEGGWITRITKTPAPVVYELCWSRFDVHMLLEGAVPPRHSADKLDLHFEMEFEPVDPKRAGKIIAKAEELPWRSHKEYQDLPLFSWNNRFDRVLTDVPSEQTSNQTLWWASDYQCFRDNSVGYDDSFSVSIKRSEASPKASAWSTLSWAHPFNERPKHNRRFRFTAMVKTVDCTGPVRLAHYSSIENLGDMYYGGRKSHNEDGSHKVNGLVWEFSQSVSGTTDWTPVSLEFVVKHHGSTLVLENGGTGQCWFDNVKIEELGKVPPERQ